MKCFQAPRSKLLMAFCLAFPRPQCRLIAWHWTRQHQPRPHSSPTQPSVLAQAMDALTYRGGSPPSPAKKSAPANACAFDGPSMSVHRNWYGTPRKWCTKNPPDSGASAASAASGASSGRVSGVARASAVVASSFAPRTKCMLGETSRAPLARTAYLAWLGARSASFSVKSRKVKLPVDAPVLAPAAPPALSLWPRRLLREEVALHWSALRGPYGSRKHCAYSASTAGDQGIADCGAEGESPMLLLPPPPPPGRRPGTREAAALATCLHGKRTAVKSGGTRSRKRSREPPAASAGTSDEAAAIRGGPAAGASAGAAGLATPCPEP
mmetsp:Transcript_35435/g.79958  ORF Transcript_35435/g.79958 Transcript_35435/m.79958 type:complete len:325 (+) Transcript_35435:89-1063(+)